MGRFATALGTALVMAAVTPAWAGATPTVTEFASGFTAGASVHELVAGPDGNIWATDNANGKIDRVSPSGAVTVFGGLSSGSAPAGITVGPDSALWFVASGSSQVGRMDTSGNLTNAWSMTGTAPQAIVAGPDGALWFTESGTPGKIGRLTTAGALTEYPVPTASSSPWAIASGPDGKLWFTEHTNPGKVGKIDPVTHAVTEYSLGTGLPYDVLAGPDGNIWVTLGASPGKVARIATDGTGYQEWPAPTTNATPMSLTRAPDGYMYFTEKTGTGGIGRISTGGVIDEYLGGSTAGFAASSTPWGIAAGQDGNIWFAESASGKGVARLNLEPYVDTGSASAITATGATLSGELGPGTQAASAYFEYGPTASYGAQTPTTGGLGGSSPVPVSAQIAQLTPGATYHFRLVSVDAGGTRRGSDATFTTAPPSPAGGSTPGDADGSSGEQPTSGATPGTSATSTDKGGGLDPGAGSGPFGTPVAPVPVLAREVVVSAGSGSVSIRLPGTGTYVPLDSATSIPVGSTIDTRAGAVRLTSVRGRGLSGQTATFRGGIFQVRQRRSGMTDLYLRGGDFGACHRTLGRGKVAAAGSRTVRHLWGQDHHGHFRTHGSRAIVTVRGTEWTVADRCDGTFTSVARGKVDVRDVAKRRHVLLRAGQSYLARAR